MKKHLLLFLSLLLLPLSCEEHPSGPGQEDNSGSRRNPQPIEDRGYDSETEKRFDENFPGITGGKGHAHDWFRKRSKPIGGPN